jgi:hypothetical protein
VVTSVGDPPELESDAIAAWCMERTGLQDFGGTGFCDRLEVIVQIMREHPDLAGQWRRRGAIEDLVDITTSRLQLQADWNANAGILTQRIERPLIVIGIPRSGTTLIHSLLAEDPAGRAPTAWEVLFPSPPPSLAAPGDPRRARAREQIKNFCLRTPGLLIAHPYWDMWENALMECESLYSVDLQAAYLTSFMRTPARLDLGGGVLPGLGEVNGVYRIHKAMLQQLQWRGPDRSWVLKGNRHSLALDTLRATYPDADVIWIHRHPAKTFASLMELMVTVREGVTGRPFAHADIGPAFMESYATGLATAMKSPALDSVHHLRYSELAGDPVAAVRSIYDLLDRDWTAEHERRMRAWQADEANIPNRRGTFHYDLSWFGLKPGQLHERFADYVERFGLSDRD